MLSTIVEDLMECHNFYHDGSALHFYHLDTAFHLLLPTMGVTNAFQLHVYRMFNQQQKTTLPHQRNSGLYLWKVLGHSLI